jgi:hypothetical protein
MTSTGSDFTRSARIGEGSRRTAGVVDPFPVPGAPTAHRILTSAADNARVKGYPVAGRTDVASVPNTIRLAADLERAVATEDPVRTKASLELLRQALLASLADAGPRGSQLIAGLVAELDELEVQLETGRVRWLGGIERQCRILSRV